MSRPVPQSHGNQTHPGLEEEEGDLPADRGSPSPGDRPPLETASEIFLAYSKFLVTSRLFSKTVSEQQHLSNRGLGWRGGGVVAQGWWEGPVPQGTL